MLDMFRNFLIGLAVTVLVSGGIVSGACASPTIPSSSGESFSGVPQEQRVCGLVQRDLDRGADIRTVVITGIQMGYNACLVVKCALSSGGDPREVIRGAIYAGAPSDVVARCAIDAGAAVSEVVTCLRGAGTNTCYVQPLGYSEPPATPPGPPAAPPASPALISPYKP
jgi:hypothetical protein